MNFSLSRLLSSPSGEVRRGVLFHDDFFTIINIQSFRGGLAVELAPVDGVPRDPHQTSPRGGSFIFPLGG